MEILAGQGYVVEWNGSQREVKVQYVRAAQGNGEGNSQDGQQEAYCHFVGTDSRLDEWLPFERFLRTSEQPHPDSREASPTDTRPRDGGMAQPDLKRKRTRETKSVEPSSRHGQASEIINPTTALQPKIFSYVVFGSYEIKCWYSSPYVLDAPGPSTSSPRSVRIERSISASSLASESKAPPSIAPAPRSRPTQTTTARATSTEVPRNRGRFVKGVPRTNARGRGRPRTRKLETNDQLAVQESGIPLSADVSNPEAANQDSADQAEEGDVGNTSLQRGEDCFDQAQFERVSPQLRAGWLGMQLKAAGATTLAEYEAAGLIVSPDFVSSPNLIVSADNEPLRLAGGAASDIEGDIDQGEGVMAVDEDGAITDSTEEDTSMQIASSSRQVSLGPEQSSRGPSPRLAEGNTSTGATPQVDKARVQLEPPAREIPPFRSQPVVPASTKLYVCEGCFKYTTHAPSYALHLKTCQVRKPPGRKVYQRGAHTVWEVDGELAKTYCQHLCLFGKMFIDHKYVFFETSGFMFYVLTEGRPTFDHPLGFFSKEKISYNDYNLACIVTFPPYQKRGFGSLMIEFSYELSARTEQSRRAGTPERPLSDLGLRGYLQFWSSVLIRYFRLIFFTRNDPRLVDPRDFVKQQSSSKANSQKKHSKGWQGEVAEHTADGEALVAIASQTPATAGLGATGAKGPTSPDQKSPSASPAKIDGPSAAAGRRKPLAPAAEPNEPFEMRFSLAEIANATRLREDDVAFTLLHSGLARTRALAPGARSIEADGANVPVDEHDMEVVISPYVVEEVAKRMRVKPPVMSRAHCLL